MPDGCFSAIVVTGRRDIATEFGKLRSDDVVCTQVTVATSFKDCLGWVLVASY